MIFVGFSRFFPVRRDEIIDRMPEIVYGDAPYDYCYICGTGRKAC